MPWWAIEISPGAGYVAAADHAGIRIVWCGERNGRVVTSASPGGRRPRAL